MIHKAYLHFSYRTTVRPKWQPERAETEKLSEKAGVVNDRLAQLGISNEELGIKDLSCKTVQFLTPNS
jgi:hypothetical protein